MAINNMHAKPKFHVNTTTIGNGLEYPIDGLSSEMNLFFKISTSGTFIAIVEAYNYDVDSWFPYDVYQRPSFTLMENGITDVGYVYNVDLKAIDKIRVRLTAINGTLSCFGTVVG